jgi:hypothetical protein
MRIQGRFLRPSNLAERRVLKSLGVDVLRVPRRLNPFAVGRHIKRIASGIGGDLPTLRKMLAPVLTPPTLPDSSSEERDAERAA